MLKHYTFIVKSGLNLVVFYAAVKVDSSIIIEECKEVYPPREDSYLLLRAVDVKPRERVLEIGTGTGIIALHCAKIGAKVTATDINPHAVQCARKNAEVNGLEVEVLEGDLFAPIRDRYDVIIFNPPYLQGYGPKDWAGGKGGVETALRFLMDAKKHLNPHGRIYLVLSSESDISKFKENCRDWKIMHLLSEHVFFEEIYAFEIRWKEHR